MFTFASHVRRGLCAAAVAASIAACGHPQNPARIHGGGLEPPDRVATRYFPKDPDDIPAGDMRGEASWYGAELHGNRTANGESFDMYALTAAHRTLPFNTIVRVFRVDDRRSVVVRINDRGPGSRHRCIDLSWAAAWEIGMDYAGHADVTLEILEWGDGAVYER